jgi:hypothetical protein
MIISTKDKTFARAVDINIVIPNNKTRKILAIFFFSNNNLYKYTEKGSIRIGDVL